MFLIDVLALKVYKYLFMDKNKEQFGKVLKFPYSKFRFLNLYLRQARARKKALFISSIVILVFNIALLIAAFTSIFCVVN
ncbi:MAG: hypothetical protein FJZ43_04405 [Candidatus Staskawiczbacteria bacterium]|nr:hypothetical protein [Candidatus Staskawiczbacteria bacterium]